MAYEDFDTLDKEIVKYIGVKTPREIANAVGCTPDEVLRRKDQLFNEVDVLDLEQQKVKVLWDLRKYAQEAHDRAQNIAPELYSGALNSAINAQKEVIKHIDNELSAARDVSVEQLNLKRVHEIVRLVTQVFGTLIPILQDRYGVPREEIEGEVIRLLEVEAERMEQDAL